MASEKNSQIKKLRDKVVKKLDELLENDNAQIVLKSCTTILDLDSERDKAVGDKSGSRVKALAELINNPRPNRGLKNE